MMRRVPAVLRLETRVVTGMGCGPPCFERAPGGTRTSATSIGEVR